MTTIDMTKLMGQGCKAARQIVVGVKLYPESSCLIAVYSFRTDIKTGGGAGQIGAIVIGFDNLNCIYFAAAFCTLL